MLDLGMLYFNRDRRLTAPDGPDPFILAENLQRLGYNLVDAAGTHIEPRVPLPVTQIGKLGRLQSHMVEYHIRFLFGKLHHPSEG
jgi:hypothetical protein